MDDQEMTDIRLDAGIFGASKSLSGVLGVPTGAGPWPGVVVVHEAFGVTDEMRKQVAHLARLGYLALMPDLFSDGGARRCTFATFRAFRTGTGRAFADIETARQTLLAHDNCTGAVGIIGFCLGGGFALLAASRGFGAASSNYGLLPRDLDFALVGACPIVGSYGGRDPVLRNAVPKLERVLTMRGVPHDLKEYPDAGHRFMNEEQETPLLARPLVRVMNFGPQPEAAVDAWNRIDAFLTEHLAKPLS